MDNLLLYLLKVSAGTSLLYLCYLLLFRKDTFYLRNRILLMLILVLPAIFPFIKIPVATNKVITDVPVNTFDNIVYSVNAAGTPLPGTTTSIDYNRLFILIYFGVAAVLLIRIVISLISTYRIIKKGEVNRNQFPKVIISSNQLPPFSFFPYAVIPAEDFRSGNYIDILDHEFAHLRQGHTFDLLLSELFIAFQWFNPFVWLIKRSVILNHEYLADQVSLTNNKSAKEYQYRLLNFQTGLKHISLAHNFNSLIKNRIIMINKKPTRKYAALKNILILPLVAIVVYAFATPEYHSSVAAPNDNSLNIYQPAAVLQKEAKGKVVKEDGKPLERVGIMSTGKVGNSRYISTDSEGRFRIANIEDDAHLSFMLRGYKSQSIKADFNSEMVIKMIKDPDYVEPNYETESKDKNTPPMPLTVLDGVVTNQPVAVINSKLGADLGTIKYLKGKEATDKYGEAGKNGVTEIYSRKKAKELGIKVPFRREGPEDFPTFQGKGIVTFNDWVVSQIKYPAEAIAQKVHGRITVNFTVEPDGSVDNVKIMGGTNQLLGDAVVKAVLSSPKWEPAKNPDAREPLPSTASFKFELPEKISMDDTYIVVEQMPQYPGGDIELLNFIKSNTKYPVEAKNGKIEGRVIIRFFVNKEGNAEEPIILKGVDPLLDAEAIRVVTRLKGFNPGTQDGKPVNVYYMVPVNFSLAEPEPLFSQKSLDEILKFIGMNTGYPQAAKNSADTGKIFIVVKMGKGGIVKECKAFTEKTAIKVPFLPEVVIVAYKTPGPGDIRPGKVTGNVHIELKTESERVVNKIGSVDIPEWKDKDMEFALTLNFVLK